MFLPPLPWVMRVLDKRCEPETANKIRSLPIEQTTGRFYQTSLQVCVENAGRVKCHQHDYSAFFSLAVRGADHPHPRDAVRACVGDKISSMMLASDEAPAECCGEIVIDDGPFSSLLPQLPSKRLPYPAVLVF